MPLYPIPECITYLYVPLVEMSHTKISAAEKFNSLKAKYFLLLSFTLVTAVRGKCKGMIDFFLHLRAFLY